MRFPDFCFTAEKYFELTIISKDIANRLLFFALYHAPLFRYLNLLSQI